MSTETISKAPHALYRFYNSADVLLYIGLTVNIGARFSDHRLEKPWWTEISRIALEHFPDRRSVAAAERAAIIAEKPLHNVQHNGARSTAAPANASGERLRFGLEVGFVVALVTDLPGGLQCFVGEVQAIDDLGVRITLVDWIVGMFNSRDLFVTWHHVLGASVWTEEHSIFPGELERVQNKWNGDQD